MNRQKLLLFVLLTFLILSLGYSYWRMPREKTVAQQKYVRGGTAVAVKRDVTQKSGDTRLHLELLDSQINRFTGFQRNIFRPIFHEDLKMLNKLPPPPPPPSKKAPPPPPPVEVQGPTLPPGGETPAYVKDMATFTFLGFMKKDHQKTIFLSRNNEIFLVKKGDRIGDKYEVVSITDDALTINVLPEGNEMIIPLEENKALTPMKK